ncbi:ribonuclease Y [Demequina aurantiaca]|uniref:ribonuclease Y n=1 Tax=Demequina aurantiaca TaxID=676200 RepID=UPI00078552EE|nr:ribonuclease Y [Demequina aurantiaca]
MLQSTIIVLLLGASLIALLLVMFARREAKAIREAAQRETKDIRDDARQRIDEAKHREERALLREKETAEEHRNAQRYSRNLEERVAMVAKDEKRIAAEREQQRAAHVEAIAALAGTTADEAKAELVARLTGGARADAAAEVRRIEKAAKRDADERGRKILVEAMQRQAAPTAAEASVTWIDLPSEEMKGRIIGREGRNIRAFEALTGVNVIVEEGVNAVQLSCFDVERREIAEVTLAALVEDGRIQPQRVEAAYARAVAGAAQRHRDAGLDALEAAKVKGVPQEIVDTLGLLRLRSSYGQNVLAHLVETAQIAADIAVAVGADVESTRRGAFLHDLGKAYSHEREGTHAAIGAEIAERAGETETVVNAIAAHHDEVEPASIEAVIVQVADAISASRPGARREDVEHYVERMNHLEKFVSEHAGVKKAVSMAAGREVRVVVEPDEVDDEGTRELARTIADHISKEFNVPGEIRVTVIRELRADAVAG